MASQGQMDERKYGTKCKKGDIVTMRLDMDSHHLSFDVNDTEYGVAFQVDAHESYRAVVELYAMGDSVELLSYHNTVGNT